MKKIGNHFKNTQNDSIEFLVKKIMNNKIILKYLKYNNFTEEDVRKAPILFEECMNSLNENKNMEDIDFHNSNNLNNYFKAVKKDEQGNYYLILEPNKKMKDYLIKSKHLKNYIINDAKNYYELSLQNLNLENMSNSYKSIYEILKKDKHNLRKGFYIWGDFGIGKTYLMIAYLNDLARNGIKVSFVKTSSFFQKLKNLELKEEIESMIYDLKRSQVLVFDEVGSNEKSIYQDDYFYNILDYRLENKLLTFFTSNFSVSQLENLFSEVSFGINNQTSGKRITSRINALALEVELIGKNMRK